MISMDFLTRRVAGTEFIDFQNEDFFTQLTACIKEHLVQGAKGMVLQESVTDDLLKLIEVYTGFNNIKPAFSETGNLYVDVGYFSPNHVLNSRGVEAFLKTTQTSLYRYFTESKEKIFQGSIDYGTGRVSGSFKAIPVELGINVNVEAYFPEKGREKWGAPLEALLAGAIVHELGHVFSGCMMLSTVLEDNIVARSALNHYRDAKRAGDRMVVLKDTATLLGLKPAQQDELLEFAKSEDDESFLMYFTKLTSQRNSQRSLSVGVAHMTSEVVADMYAIRMGCGKGIIAAVGTLTDRGVIVPMLNNLLGSAALAVIMGYIAFIPAAVVGAPTAVVGATMISSFLVFATLGYFSSGYSDIYNADHRRMEDGIRQLIAKLKEVKGMPASERDTLIKDITQLLELNKQMQPWYEGTFVYRMMGWVFSGSDFKKREIEHYTQALNNHELTLVNEQLKGV